MSAICEPGAVDSYSAGCEDSGLRPLQSGKQRARRRFERANVFEVSGWLNRRLQMTLLAQGPTQTIRYKVVAKQAKLVANLVQAIESDVKWS